MLEKILSLLSSLFLLLLIFVTVHSCANIASPTGGPYDVTPPVVKGASPNFNSLNVTQNKIEIEFDEIIKVTKPTEKVIITPPQQNMPIIRAVGKKAVVELKDELQPDRTYTIDFTDAIVDNNEDNPLEGFVYSFSTGNHLDTFSIAGRVLAADNLEPLTGIYVGVHTNFDDTVFTNLPFERISRTNSFGDFVIRGMAPGSYRVFALDDQNRDYKYDNPQEMVAFLDSIVTPFTMPAIRSDTIFADSITIDTIISVQYTRFMPDDLLLLTFLSEFRRQYLQRNERPEEHQLSIVFGAPTDMPTISLLDPDITVDNWYLTERSAHNDTLLLWITDSIIFREDSIKLQIEYIKTDTLNQNLIVTDTLNFNFRRSEPKAKKKKESKEKEDDEVQIDFLKIKTNISSAFELFNPIRIEFEQPVLQFDSSYLQLLIEVDSLYESVPFRFETDSLNPRKFVLRPKWEPGAKYRMLIDSAVVSSYWGLWNNRVEQSFTVNQLDKYGNLEINIRGIPEGKQAFVELLDKTDKPIRKNWVKGSIARFQDLPPGELYARLIVDDNEDGEWTTGDYDKQRQPERVFYYPGLFLIREHTDHTEEWNIRSTPVIKQKPLEITKNKPEEKKKRDLNREREQQRGSSPSGVGTGRGAGSRQTGSGSISGSARQGVR